MEENKQKFRELEKLISELRKMFDVAKGAQITEVKKIAEGVFGKLAKALEAGLGPQTLNAVIPSNVNAIWRAFNEIKRYFITGDPNRDQDSKIDRLSETLDEKFNEIKDMIEAIEFRIDDEKNNPTKAVAAVRNFYEPNPEKEDEKSAVQIIDDEFAKQLQRSLTNHMKEDLLRKVNSDFYDIDPKRRDIIRKEILKVLESGELQPKVTKVFETKRVVKIEDVPLDISDSGMEENVLTCYRSYCKARGIDLNKLLSEEQEEKQGKKQEKETKKIDKDKTAEDFKTFETEINNAVSRESNKENKQILDSNVIE